MPQTERYLDLPLEDVIGDRFGRYSKYIIQERALPDIRDGLKPVQRRILYAMYHEGNTFDKPFRKSAKTVGNVIGNYHPHGDSSVYEAMVRMSQDWKVRNLLIEMHGNNGSIDGDPPAAMRYTEARLSAIAAELLRDLDKDTVDFIPNFDDSEEEPVVLPAMFPNLLVNGSTGISAGYATDIPPHHLGEVIDAAIAQMKNPDITLDELMTYVKGPDFPTGAIVQGIEGIRQAYETGKGRVIVRAKAEIEEIKGRRQQIVITEIPYDVVKANLVKKMDELRFDKKIDGIVEVRDDTDRTGLRIIVELKKDADANSMLNFLYKNTDLQVTYNFNMVAIHHKRPQLVGLKQMLHAYIEHQKNVVRRRSNYELRKAEARAHIVQGLMKAISILDEVIAIIRGSKDKKDAKNNLIERFAFTEPQAEAIVTLQLYRLTNTDITTLKKEADDLAKTIKQLQAILGSEAKLIQVITKDLQQLKERFSDERRTVIEDKIEEIKINLEEFIPQEETIVTVTKEGYVKRTSPRSYAASNSEPPGMKEDDYLIGQFNCSTTDILLIFTTKGYYLHLPIHQLPDIRWKDSGQHVANFVSLEQDDDVIDAIVVSDFPEDEYLLFMTRSGLVKRSQLSLYKAQRFSKPLVAIRLKDDDRVINVYRTDGKSHIFLASNTGYGLWFAEDEITPIGLRASGVKGINLKEQEFVVSGVVFSELEEQVEFLLITHRGSVKKMSLKEFEKSTRAKRGLTMLRELKANPHKIAVFQKVTSGDVFTILTDKDKSVDIKPEEYRPVDRYNNGSFIIDAQTEGHVVQGWRNISAQTTES